MGVKLDDLDFKIIHQLQGDGRISITDLADKVGSSRPTVARLYKGVFITSPSAPP
jgi:DNA-binding Lrp family transcriptional regulator